MKCVVCARQAKGFGWFNTRFKRSDPRRYSDRWVFCSMRCQNAFSKLMERLTSFQEDAVIDPSEMEIAAMQSALIPLGECVASIGMDRPLADYRKQDVLRLIEVVIDAYQAHMLAEHEREASRERAYFEQQAARRTSVSSSTHNNRTPSR